MLQNKWLIKVICVCSMIPMLAMGCVTSTRGTGDYTREKVGEYKTKSEKVNSSPRVEITQRPTVENPDFKFKTYAEIIKKSYYTEKYVKKEKVKKTTSGGGFLALGVIGLVGGLFQMLGGALSQPSTTDTTLTDEEYDNKEEKADAKFSSGVNLMLLSIVPLIIGASTDKKSITSHRVVDRYERTHTKSNNTGKIVPQPNLKVSATLKDAAVHSMITITTDGNSEATFRADELLARAIPTLKTIPENTSIIIEQNGSNKAEHTMTFEKALAIMSHGKIDWAKGPEGLTPFPQASLKIIGSSKAGETITLRLHVSNKNGKGDCYRLQGMVESNEDIFKRRILIGRLPKGQEITIEDRVDIPRGWMDRAIPLNIVFTELYSNIPDPLQAQLFIEGLPRPALAYSYQIIDDGRGNSVGNGDGQLQKGEAVDIEVTVNNTGADVAKNTRVQIDFIGKPDSGLRIVGNKKSFVLGNLQPNESKKCFFTLNAKKNTRANSIKLELKISEINFRVSTVDNLDVKIGAPTTVKILTINKTGYVLTDELAVRNGASADTAKLYGVPKNSAINIVGQLGDWYKVDLGNNQTGWVAKNSINLKAPANTPTTNVAATPMVIKVMQKSAPFIVVASPAKDVINTTETSIKIIGAVRDDRSVEKVDFVLNGQKLKTLSTRGINVVEKPDTIKQPVPRYGFEQEINLDIGKNEIKIIATDDEKLTNIPYTIIVNRTIEQGEVRVLVVGISDYNDPNINSLPYAEVDAQSIVDFFKNNSRSFVKPENITYLSGANATSRNIRRSISQLAKKTKKEDMVIFYYAGHGDVGKHPTNNAEYYLIPVDAEKDDLFASAMELSEVQRLWGAVISKRKIFIADACNSGGFTNIRGEVSGFEQGMGEGTIVMTASNKGEKALEDPTLKHGLFTYYLLKGLQGEANNDNDKRISITELKKYIDDNVPNKARELGSKQTPVIKIETSGEIYLTK